MSHMTHRTQGSDIRVMSSNILFDKTLADRLPLIADCYRSSDADLIGMQEVNNVGTALFDLLSDLYTPVAASHQDGKHCFTPILYRADRLELLEGGSALYRLRATDTKSMAWAVFADRKTGKKLALINTHSAIILPFHKLEATDPVEGEQWRTDNVLQMLEKKDELRAKYGDTLPVFITGDFNASAKDESIKTMKKTLPDSADIATGGATVGINSYHGAPGRPCPAGNPIDFIFVTDDTVEVLVHNIPHDETALAISDHCPTYIDANLK